MSDIENIKDPTFQGHRNIFVTNDTQLEKKRMDKFAEKIKKKRDPGAGDPFHMLRSLLESKVEPFCTPERAIRDGANQKT